MTNDTNVLLSGRRFQLWDYSVRHGSLLIRSPNTPETRSNIDIACFGVEYIALPRMLGEITIEEPREDDVSSVQGAIGKAVDRARILVLRSGASRFCVVAAAWNVEQNFEDMFYSPLEVRHL